MPKLKLNEHFRWLIVEKTLEGVSCRKIARQLNICKSSVSKVFLYFKKYGCVENLSLQVGRSRIFKADDMKYLESLLKEKVDWYIWELQSEMELWLDRHISYAIIWRAINRLGYTHKQQYRLEFIVHMSQYSATQLVFSDEAAYDRRTLSRCYGWDFRGKQGALCLNSLLAYAIQEGPMNEDPNSFSTMPLGSESPPVALKDKVVTGFAVGIGTCAEKSGAAG
ncbi:4849_t:CDS:2 [Funneliformis caledonium]|uniref:4849_t:CDS:1 n=1 Tax=Funneliformis caledonium TaxID=1117310 RepID=A0A9N9AS51_9GLOM|nr:4849_t:CDS:2 [Funneliformis caledonium]